MKTIRQHLGWKLFFSYLTIIVIGVVTLAIAAEIHIPTALDRHMAGMATMMGDGSGGMMADLTQDFTRAVNEVLLVAATAALFTAILISTFVTRRIVRPIQEMKEASRRIANGRYEERVQVMGEDELAELGLSFNQMAHQLAETEARRRRLIGDVAHELRTPLSSMKGVVEGLQDGVLPADPTTFADVQRELGRLQRLVNDLEELSRAEAGQIPLETEPVDPALFIQAAVDRLRLQFEDKDVALDLALESNRPLVQVDTQRMAQVMLNLLGNALQYTPLGGQVTVRTWRDQDHVIIAVQDTGTGVSAEHLPHLFERFFRVDKSRSRAGGGSGIGLTISKHLVEAHGGRIWAASPGPGLGSTFTFTIPIVR